MVESNGNPRMETGAVAVNFPSFNKFRMSGKLPAAAPTRTPPYRKSGKMRLSILLS